MPCFYNQKRSAGYIVLLNGEGRKWEGGGSTYDIDENIQRFPGPLLHQLRRVVLRPLCLFVLAEVAAECFLAPGAIARVGDWRVRGDGSVFAGVLEELMRRRVIPVS